MNIERRSESKYWIPMEITQFDELFYNDPDLKKVTCHYKGGEKVLYRRVKLE